MHNYISNINLSFWRKVNIYTLINIHMSIFIYLFEKYLVFPFEKSCQPESDPKKTKTQPESNPTSKHLMSTLPECKLQWKN